MPQEIALGLFMPSKSGRQGIEAIANLGPTVEADRSMAQVGDKQRERREKRLLFVP